MVAETITLLKFCTVLSNFIEVDYCRRRRILIIISTTKKNTVKSKLLFDIGEYSQTYLKLVAGYPYRDILALWFSRGNHGWFEEYMQSYQNLIVWTLWSEDTFWVTHHRLNIVIDGKTLCTSSHFHKVLIKILFTIKQKVTITKLLLLKASEKKKSIIYPTLLLRRPLK